MSRYWSYTSPNSTQLLSFTLSFTLQAMLVPVNISDVINNFMVLDSSFPLGIRLINRKVDVSAFQPNCKYYLVDRIANDLIDRN